MRVCCDLFVFVLCLSVVWFAVFVLLLGVVCVCRVGCMCLLHNGWLCSVRCMFCVFGCIMDCCVRLCLVCVRLV